MAYVDKHPEVVETALSGRKGLFCVAARDLVTGDEVLYNAETMMPACSTFKVPVLVHLLRRRDAGEVSLEERHVLTEEDKCPGSGVLKEMCPGLTLTVKDMAMLMIIISDNTATDLLVGKLGADNVTATMHSLGFNSTYIPMGCKGILCHFVGIEKRNPTKAEVTEAFTRMKEHNINPNSVALKGVPENVVTSPLDMVNLFERLYRGDLMSAESTGIAFDILKRQQLTARIPAMLPLGTVVAHKTGSLWKLFNDTGIVYPKNGNPYAIAIYTDQSPDELAQLALAKISRAVYDHFQGKSTI